MKTRRYPKKFRFHVLYNFIKRNYNPCRVLDVGGGKGILSFLLNQSGFESIVVDPVHQLLPDKFRKSLDKSDGRYLLRNGGKDSVERITDIFRPEMVKGFDLIVGLHAHGCMYHTIEQSAIHDKNFILVPCCIVDEPIEKPYGVNWDAYVSRLAKESIPDSKETKLNIMGNSLTIYRT